MGTFQKFWKQPQRLFLRRVLFQIHLWIGVGLGIYVLLIAVSGSVVVFRQDVFAANDSPIITVAGVGQRLDSTQIGEAAKKVWPGYEVMQVYEYEDPKRAVEVRLEKGSRAENRLFDPYTGEDLGHSVPWPIRVMSWFEDLHTELFAGRVGRQINAIGGALWSILALTGIVVWWPGAQNWKRGLYVRMSSGWKRVNWDLHSSLGFWTFLLTLMWGVTGVFAAIPDPFRAAVEYIEPLRPIPPPPESDSAVQRGSPQEQGGVPAPPGQRGQRGGRGRRQRFKPRVGDKVLRGAYALHFGNFAGTKLKIAWVVLGLAPAVLFLTGVLMWVNRVIRKIPTP